MKPLFITGASGFVGIHVLETLRVRQRDRVVCLTRDPESLTRRIPPLAGWRYLKGDITRPGEWAGLLERGGAVLHLAAATGKATAAEHEAVNVEGTRAVVQLCSRLDVSRLVFVSSIAAKFKDRTHYPYAESKRTAEGIVRESGCPFVIVRPTMVFGRGSPALHGLRRLASGIVGVVPGDGRVKVQPVDVQDLATALVGILEDPALIGREVEIGGPDQLTIEDLLRRIRALTHGPRGPFIRLPLPPIRRLVTLLERIVGGYLPLSAGQLASFANDGTAAEYPSGQWTVANLRGLDSMLASHLLDG